MYVHKENIYKREEKLEMKIFVVIRSHICMCMYTHIYFKYNLQDFEDLWVYF